MSENVFIGHNYICRSKAIKGFDLFALNKTGKDLML